MASLLGRIASFFARKATNRHVQLSLLEKLPTELIKLICSHLSRMDTACLAVCSHALLLKIGTDSLQFSRRSEQDGKDREDLLTRISLDIPSYFFCHVCHRLHLWKFAFTPKEGGYCPKFSCVFRDDTGCLVQNMDTNKQGSTYYFFHFVHLQLAMRKYYHGPGYGLSTDSLSYEEVIKPQGEGVTTLLSVEAQICPEHENRMGNSLLLRVQQWAIMPNFCPDIMSLAGLVYMDICNHIYLGNACKEFVTSSEAEKENATSPMYQCHKCLADFQFQLQDIETRKNTTARALIVTKWFDLGDGQNPESPQWVAHVPKYPETRLPRRDIGSVCLRFESNFGSSQQELTQRNKCLMNKEGFRDVLRDHGIGKWSKR